jgi:hypothetical protein
MQPSPILAQAEDALDVPEALQGCAGSEGLGEHRAAGGGAA